MVWTLPPHPRSQHHTTETNYDWFSDDSHLSYAHKPPGRAKELQEFNHDYQDIFLMNWKNIQSDFGVQMNDLITEIKKNPKKIYEKHTWVFHNRLIYISIIGCAIAFIFYISID